jgi:hypothetical protein
MMFVCFLVLCALSAPAWSRAMRPGQWRWNLSETTPMGAKHFVSLQCVSANGKPDFSAPGASAALDCYRHEKAYSSPGGNTLYRFSCHQQNGPISTLSTGAIMMHVSLDGRSVSLSGRVNTDISGAVSMHVVSAMSGTGTRIGPCH